MPPIPTQSDIARQLGISKMAVSQALRNHPRISLATREKVAELAAKMGYQINAHARSLATRRSRALQDRLPIALLNLWSPPAELKKEKWALAMISGCQQRAEALGYYIDEFDLKTPGMTARRGNQILKSRGIRGVLVAPTPHSHSHLNLEWGHFAAVAIGFTLRRPNLHRITINQAITLQLAFHHLKHSGYRRIGLLLDKRFVRRVDGDPEAHFLHQQKNLPAKDRVPILWCTWEDVGGRLSAWLDRYRPDVVMTYWTSVFQLLIAAGYSIPRDMGFVHLSCPGEAQEELGVQATGITMNNQELGAKAVDLVVAQMEHNEFGIPTSPNITLTTPCWVPGDTIR